MTDKIDHYHTGNIDFNDFLTCIYYIENRDRSKFSIRKAFEALDKDGTGLINWDELKHLLGNLGEKLSESEI